MPTLAIDAAGALHVAYGTRDGVNSSALLYATNASGSWHYKSLGWQGDRPSIAVGPSGLVHLAYLMNSGSIEYVVDPLALPGSYAGELLEASEGASVARTRRPSRRT